MLRITKEQLTALKPCNPETRLALFKRRKTMDVKSALAAGVSICDILWVAGKLGRKDLCIAFALACAVRAEKFDKTGTAKPCNDATAAYIADPSPAKLELLRTARRAAYAYAAYAAYAAAAAAADADAAYAYAAAYAAAAARKREVAAQKRILIRIFGGAR